MDDLNRALYWGIDCSQQPEISSEVVEAIREELLFDALDDEWLEALYGKPQ